MFQILFLFIFYCSMSYADIFSKSTGDNQVQLDKNLTNDAKGFYHRSGMDYNIFDGENSDYELRKVKISLGCERFNLRKSIRSYALDQIKSSDISGLASQLTGTPLLFLQYSSPSMADLLKHFDSTARLQLAIRYKQCQDLEQIEDPITRLRKQAQMDCLRQAGHENNLDAAFEFCPGDIYKPLSTLNDPQDGRTEIDTGVDVTTKTLDRVNQGNKEDLDDVKSIIPHVTISADSVRFQSPNQRVRQVMFKNKESFMSSLKKIIEEYKQNKTVSNDSLKEISVAGTPITEIQVKNMAMLDDTTAYLAMSKIASQLAFLKTMDLYIKALEYLKRVLNHPAIEPGYKEFIQEDYDFIAYEMDMLKKEKDRLEDYFNFMGTILNEEDAQKLKALARIKNESIQEEKKGLFNLNP